MSSIWKAINILTHKNRSYNTSAVNAPPESLNDHFVSLPSRLLQSLMGNSDPDGYVCTSFLLDFCRERRGPFRAFHTPLLNVYEVGKLITGLKSITAFFTIFNLDLDHSTHVTLLCLHCVTCGYLLLIAQRY